MDYTLIELDDAQSEAIASALEAYDDAHMPRRLSGQVRLGVALDGQIIAGADGCMTAFRIFYISTVFVAEAYRRKGIGKILMDNMEKRAASLGANLIRLDTFDWQGAAFYRKLGYEQVGGYSSEVDGFAEYFFIKRLGAS